MKKIYFLVACCIVACIGFGQTTTEKNKPSERDKKKQERKDKIKKLIKEEEEGALIYSKQTAIGFKLNTDGWGASFEHGKYKTIKKTSLWWVEIGERKSLKEEKVTNGQDLGGGFLLVGNPYIYGKQNNFYYFKAGLGQQTLIGGKGNKNGVAVSAIYGGGLSLGYLKPYFLNVSTDGSTDRDIKYNASDSVDANAFLDPGSINGASGFTKGFSDGKFVPGAFGRLALRFDYGRFNEFLSAFEVGINAEYYSKTMPIMINNPEKKFFFNGYIAIEFGSRK
ncbi:hypothetical protein BH11BAC6_BH11BAC6_09610 [soil metagenome]